MLAERKTAYDGDARRVQVLSTLARLSKTGALPVLPAAGASALRMARDPDVGIDDVAGVLESDVGLVARLLQVTNSATYYTPPSGHHHPRSHPYARSKQNHRPLGGGQLSATRHW